MTLTATVPGQLDILDLFRPRRRMLDLFCSAGGASMGYHLAGFDVVGVDVEPQPNYPFEFVQADALAYFDEHADEYDAAAGSPPCQSYSAMSGCRPGLAAKYPAMVDAVRAMFTAWGRPWVIENVAGAGVASQPDLLGANGLLLCGAMFGRALYRHRYFESSVPLVQPDHPVHLVPASEAGHWVPGTVISVAGNCSPIALAREVMDIDWMTRNELAESIPPYLAEYIGRQLMAHLRTAVPA